MKQSHERKARRIATLLAGYMRDTLTPAEHDELDEWVGASDRNQRLFEELTDERRVQLALELLNDQTGFTTKMIADKDFNFKDRNPFAPTSTFGWAIRLIYLLAGILFAKRYADELSFSAGIGYIFIGQFIFKLLKTKFFK